MKNRLLVSVAACLAGLMMLSSSVWAETPAPGSKVRKQLMDVLRIPCEKDLKQKVILKVEQLKVRDDWAFARVTPQRPDGKPIDYSQTQYREAAAEGVFDAMGEALLRKRGDRWELVEWRFGATDTEVELWAAKHRVPLDLFR